MARDLRCFCISRRANRKTVRVFTLFLTGVAFAYTAYGNPELARYAHLRSGEMRKNLEADVFALTVSGTVRSDKGDVLPGVSVVEKGTSNGTVTDTEGKYSFTVSNENATLVFTFIGYVNQEVALNGRTTTDVTLVEDVVALGEVVVVGYGSQRKTDLTGAVTSIPVAEISRFPTARVDQALQGRSSGVYVLNTDGSPGGNTMIRIRGLNSINGGNEPLIVVDGLQGGNLNSLNPSDIASIEILKDASATAIYGSRGANGVILITTKLGKPGKPVIDAGYNVGFQKLARKLPVMDAATYAKQFNRYKMTQTGDGNIPTPQFSDEEIANWERNGGTDWQDEVYETGVMQNYQLAISGATDKLKYLVSGNYVDHNGILLNSKYTRASLRANFAADITDWVDFGLNYAFTKETYKSPSFREEVAFVSQVVNNAPRWAPTEPVYDDLGNYWVHRSGYAANDTWNPVASAVEPIIDNPTFRNNANLFLNFKIVKGLSFKVTGGALIANRYFRDYYNSKTLSGLQNNGFGHVNESKNERLQNSNILTYDNTWNDEHHLTFTGVVEQIYEESMGSNIEGKGFLADELAFDNLGGAKSIVASSFHNERSLLSYLGRVNYVLAEKYMATFTYRADGSSVFGEKNKWGYFPSGSVAWRVSEEDFLKDSNIFTELKFRASYGLTGNQGISPYQSLARLSSSASVNNYPYNGGSVTDIGYGIGGLANPNLKWETTAQTNIGLDLSIFGGRLTSTIDWYKKVTEDLLMPRELPGYVGVSSILDNIGSIENRGLEILVGGNPLVGDLEWSTSVNLTVNRNKVLDLGPNDRIGYRPTTGGYSLGNNFMFLEVGEPFGLMNGWKFLGIWGTDQEAEAHKYGQLPGDAHYLDVDNDGDVDNNDRTTIGNGYPKFTWGWTNQFSYKGFDLSFMFMGYQGVDLFNTMRIRRDSFWEGTSPVLLDAWTPENQDTNIPGMIDGKYREEQVVEHDLQNKIFFGSNSGATSQWVEDASFIRLKTATVAYTFGQTKLSSLGFQKVRVFLSGTNIFTITDYTGYDPEVAAFTWNDATIGVDLSVYPPAKMLTIGAELTF
jgi:TonB-dependent starch-binding outer membrane protein SusC